jgi:hypothetical protein
MTGASPEVYSRLPALLSALLSISGELLDQVIAGTPPARPYRSTRQQYLPKGFLAQIGLSGSQASRW